MRSCCRLTPKPCIIYIQWVNTACDASDGATYSDGNGYVRSVDLAPPSCLRAVHCLAPSLPALIAPHTTRSADSRNLRWHVLLATVRANNRDACSDACASRHCVASAWGGQGCALPFYIACDAQPGHSQQISLCCQDLRPSYRWHARCVAVIRRRPSTVISISSSRSTATQCHGNCRQALLSRSRGRIARRICSLYADASTG